jgi:cobalamin biosynthesis protein CobW
MNQLIPVTIITGFLGSGKTTLLSRLINPVSTKREPGKRDPAHRFALLINEFGEVSIDGALLRSQPGEDNRIRVHDFPHGLIAYGDDELFIPTMRAIAAHRAQVDQVLIETSGLALPTAVMERLQGPELAADFILDATLAVVDTPLLLADQFESAPGVAGVQAETSNSVAALFERQLESADVVVLNKIDGLAEDALLQAEARVRRRAPNVRFLELAYHAQLDSRLALGLRLQQPTLIAHAHDQSQWAIPDPDPPLPGKQDRLNGHAHSGLRAHSHGLATHQHFHEHDPGWLSFTLRSHAPQPARRLKAALVEVARAEPILRIKGFVCLADSQNTAAAALVQGVRSRVTIRDCATQAPANRSELVFIGYHPSRARVAALLSELTGTSWS